LSAWQVGPQAALIALLGAATLAALWLRPAAGYPAAWFFLVLAPTSSLLPIATEVGAERRMYLPLAGLLVLMVTLGYLWLQRVAARDEGGHAVRRRHLRVGPALVAGVAMALGFASALRNLEYRDPVVLWQSVLEYRAFPRAQNNLGTELSKQHRYAESIPLYRQALQAQPESDEIRYNLAQSLEHAGRCAEAIAEYREFLRRRPDPIVHNLLGRLLSEQGQTAEAVAEYRAALRLDPAFADPYGNLGSVFLAEGRYQDAADQFASLLKLRPDDARAHNDLGLALAWQGKPDQAMVHHLRAVELQPDYAEAHFNLGVALTARGRLEEGRRHLREAVRLNPSMGSAAAAALRDLSGAAGDGDSSVPQDGATGRLRPRRQ
jgi:tetratricopeptide (TPR) repeat protein